MKAFSHRHLPQNTSTGRSVAIYSGDGWGFSGGTLLAVQETWVWSLGWENFLEREMAIHSSILAWRIPWTEEPGGLQSMGSQRAGHDWAHTHAATHIPQGLGKRMHWWVAEPSSFSTIVSKQCHPHSLNTNICLWMPRQKKKDPLPPPAPAAPLPGVPFRCPLVLLTFGCLSLISKLYHSLKHTPKCKFLRFILNFLYVCQADFYFTNPEITFEILDKGRCH